MTSDDKNNGETLEKVFSEPYIYSTFPTRPTTTFQS